MSFYILDSNFFIQSHRITYPLDIAKGFWDKVKLLAENGKIRSIDKVKDELFENDDQLKKWIEENLPNNFFISSETPEILTQYANVVTWANSRSDFYLPKALNEFLDFKRADAWLVAVALSLGKDFCIVTYEKSEPNKKSKIKIPEACTPFDVPYLNTIEMFRKLGETF